MNDWENDNDAQPNFVMVDGDPNETNKADLINTQNQAENQTEDLSQAMDIASQKNHSKSHESNYTETPQKKRSKKNKINFTEFVTKKTLIVTFIICIFVSAALGVGGYTLASMIWGNSSANSSSQLSTTNYNLAKATGSKLSIQEIIAKNANSVVEIRTESVSTDSFMQQYVTEGAGSGVIIQSDGYIITNNHVIDGATKITITLHNDKEYSATLVATDSLTDIAVLKIKETNLTAVTYGDSDALSVGDLAIAIGNPLGKLGGTATSGIISALDREITIDGKNMTLLQTDAAINPGNSGGGLFNQYGQLIGIVSAKSSRTNVEGLGFAIPVNQVSKIASELIKNGSISDRPALGVNIIDLTDAETAMQYGYKITGIYIQSVTGSNAKNAGLLSGDMIYYLDKTKINSQATLLSAIQDHKVGDTVTVTIIRDNQIKKIKVKLQEANSVK